MAAPSFVVFVVSLCLLTLCDGVPVGGTGSDSGSPVQRREISGESGQCEDILCAPVSSNCQVTATREPSQLVGPDGNPCPVCPVCLDYIADLPPAPGV